MHSIMLNSRVLFFEEGIALLLVLFVFVSPATAAMRLQDRSLYINSSEPGATTFYTVSFRYMSPQSVGSVELLACIDPIPYHACETPPGFSMQDAVLSNQTGETGYSIGSKSTNRIVLTRNTAVPSATDISSYTFQNIKNPTDTSKSYSIRLKTFDAPNATGPQIDFGSVKAQVSDGIILETQVPPMLIFCVAGQVADDCEGDNDNYYTDMGELSSSATLSAQSQMAVGTNASGGFVITVNGDPLSAGTRSINPVATLDESRQGVNQFAINLAENTTPQVGRNPEGSWTNAVAAPEYAVPNRFKYVSGDVVAYSPNVSLMKKYTVSYVVNASDSLRAGVYTTTITFIASGRF